ncbi:MAG TPA: metalloregulator ArsR/SmtB family transcription factor [Cyclobacteriaceae bacterium]|nr:metalloregulator ArsR/SmtB family transcription factor [Cyclobacteriaceae bacterium]
MANTCIRVLADPAQIKDCKHALNRLEENLDGIAKVFNLAGNPARFKILFLLHKEGQMCPCDLSDVLDISVGGVSQHLRKLKDGGLVKDKKVGKTIFYSPIEKNVAIIFPSIDELVNDNKKQLAS